MFKTKHIVYEGNKGLYFNKGKLERLLSPGQYVFWGSGHEVFDVSIQPKYEIVGGQDVSSSDGGNFRVTVGVVCQLVDPELAYKQGILSLMYGSLSMLNVAHVPTQLGIREWVTSKTFAEAYENRATLHTDIADGIRTKLATVGFEVNETYLIDMTPTGGLKAAMADLLKVEMEGQVALARARHEAATMRSLLNTAKLVRENPKLLELRILSTGQKPRVTFMVDSADSAGAISSED
jgi:regulator of protease activity HflC (stomatin/prohibitin superfamily)